MELCPAASRRQGIIVLCFYYYMCIYHSSSNARIDDNLGCMPNEIGGGLHSGLPVCSLNMEWYYESERLSLKY